MDWLKHYQKYQSGYMIGAFALLWLVNALTLATSRIMEEMNGDPNDLPFNVWEPFLWEFSSAIMILALIPFTARLLKSPMLSWQKPMISVAVMLFASLVFSLIHVSGMVAIRELVYSLAGSNYDFGNIWFGLLYEYRKDLVTFLLLSSGVLAYGFIESRIRGEASLIEYDTQKTPIIDRILVKKLGREFIVKVSEIDWLESSGNYVNLHVGEHTYPVRNTMGGLLMTIEEQGFCRTHRSFAVNLSRVQSIENVDSGGANVSLTTDKTLPVSRPYRDQLKDRLLCGFK